MHDNVTISHTALSLKEKLHTRGNHRHRHKA